MSFSPIIFYDNQADVIVGGGGSDTIQTDGLDGKAPAEAELPKPLLSDEEIKSYGFDSPEALKTFLAQHKEQATAPTPEELKEKENLEKANFLKFAAEAKLLNVDDYTQYETLKSKTDKDIVFADYLKQFKEDNPEMTDPKELEDAAREDFNYEYKIEGDALSKKAELRLAREAKELRHPIESKITAAQEQFKQNNDLRQTYPKFEGFVDEAIKRNAPDKLAAIKLKDGDKEIPIEIELTKEDRDKIAKAFKTPKTFALFTSGKPEEIQSAIDNKMQGWLFQNKKDEIASKIFSTGIGVGTARGSNVGASNPFALVDNTRNVISGDETIEQSNERIAKARAAVTFNR